MGKHSALILALIFSHQSPNLGGPAELQNWGGLIRPMLWTIANGYMALDGEPLKQFFPRELHEHGGRGFNR
jgi:hypothetical protein